MTEIRTDAQQLVILKQAVKISNKETKERIEEKVEFYEVRAFDKLA